jgi:hypothetical protein
VGVGGGAVDADDAGVGAVEVVGAGVGVCAGVGSAVGGDGEGAVTGRVVIVAGVGAGVSGAVDMVDVKAEEGGPEEDGTDVVSALFASIALASMVVSVMLAVTVWFAVSVVVVSVMLAVAVTFAVSVVVVSVVFAVSVVSVVFLCASVVFAVSTPSSIFTTAPASRASSLSAVCLLLSVCCLSAVCLLLSCAPSDIVTPSGIPFTSCAHSRIGNDFDYKCLSDAKLLALTMKSF